MVKLQVDVVNRICRYYRPIIAEQGVIYISQQLRIRPADERATVCDVERVLAASVAPLLACLRSSANANDKVEGFSMFKGFRNIFYVHGLFRLVAEARPGTETATFLTTKLASLDSRGIPSMHKAILYASISMVALHKGMELIKQWASQDAISCCRKGENSSSGTSASEYIQTDVQIPFLRDVPFNIMCQCVPLEVGTE